MRDNRKEEVLRQIVTLIDELNQSGFSLRFKDSSEKDSQSMGDSPRSRGSPSGQGGFGSGNPMGNNPHDPREGLGQGGSPMDDERREALKKLQRLNRLLAEAQKLGVDVRELLGKDGANSQEMADSPRVRVVEEGDAEATVLIDAEGAEIDWDAGEDSVTVWVDGDRITREIPFPVGEVEKEERIAMTKFFVFGE